MPTLPHRARLPLALLLPLTAIAGSLPTPAQGARLNHALGTSGAARVSDVRTTPDGGLALYRANPARVSIDELFSVPTDGSRTAIALSRVAEEAETGAFVLTPDGTLVVHEITTRSPSAGTALYVSPADGLAPPLRITPILPELALGALATDGRHVVYVERRDEAHVLLSVPIDGSETPRELAQPEPAAVLGQVAFTLDGRWVVFEEATHWHGAFAGSRILAVPVDGGAPAHDLGMQSGAERPFHVTADGWVVRGTGGASGARLLAAHVASERGARRLEGRTLAWVDQVVLDPEGEHVLYRARAGSEGFALHRARIRQSHLAEVGLERGTRTPEQRLSAPMVTGGNVMAFALSPDGAWAAYLADQEVNERFELFAVPTDGSRPPRAISGTLVAGGDVSTNHALGITSDGTLAVFVADARQDGRDELFAAALEDDAPRLRLSGDLVPGGDVSTWFPDPTGTRVVYEADQTVDGAPELWSAGLDGSPPRRLADGRATHVRVTPSGRAVFALERGAEGRRELFAAPADASSAAVRIGDPMPAFLVEDVGEPLVAPRGTHLVYPVLGGSGSVRGHYLVDAAAPGTVVRLGEGTGVAGTPSVEGTTFTPDGRNLVYDVALEARDQLFVVPLGGTMPQRVVNHTLGARDRVAGFRVDPAGTFVVYRVVDYALDAADELHRADLDGLAPPVRLGAPLPGHTDMGPDLALAADGALLVYRADAHVDATFELHAVSTAGGGTAVRLTPGQSVSRFWLTPDSRRAVFVTGATLRSVLLDGSGMPLSLGPSLFDLEIAADSVHALHVASGDLISIAIDGSAAPIALNDTAPGAGEVLDFALEPAGLRVVFRAELGSSVELFVAPIDGSQPAVRLHAPLLAPRTVEADLVVRSGEVLFRADLAGLEAVELFRVPLDASLAPRRVLAPLAAGRAVRAFGLHQDRLALIADLDVPGTFELYAARLDGGAPPLRRSSRMVWGGDVLSLALCDRGRRIVYRADQEADEAVELFGTLLTDPPPCGRPEERALHAR